MVTSLDLWFLVVILTIGCHRTKEKARKRLRKDVGEALKGVYIVNNRELSDKTIKQMKAAFYLI